MNKSKKIIIAIIVILIMYFVYKGILLYLYNYKDRYPSYNEVINSIDFKDTINITKGNNLKDYISIEDMKVKNNFKKFKLSDVDNEPNIKWYKLYDNNYKDKVKASISIGITDTYIDMFINNNNEKIFGISKDYRRNLLERNNITNDIELLRFIKKYKNIDTNIFTSTNKIKEIFIVKYFTMYLPEFKDLKLIDGDYTGYTYDAFKGSEKGYRYLEYIILKNNKRYFIDFYDKNNYFTDEVINGTINNIVIEGKD